MTRLFREGRTETVRPCTIESSAWVKSMVEGNASVSVNLHLRRIVAKKWADYFPSKFYHMVSYGNLYVFNV
jgi:Choline/Carnitine o-acyltransferase